MVWISLCLFWNFLSFSNMYIYVFYQIREVFSHYFFEHFFSSTLSYFLLALETVFIFFIGLVSRCSEWVISISIFIFSVLSASKVNPLSFQNIFLIIVFFSSIIFMFLLYIFYFLDKTLFFSYVLIIACLSIFMMTILTYLSLTSDIYSLLSS